MNTEVWKAIVGYEGLYEVSNYGRIKSLPRLRKNGKTSYYTKTKIMKTTSSFSGKDKGRKSINLTDIGGNKKVFRVHRIVAEHFIAKIEGKNVINHIDGNQSNNHFENLEWCTQRENVVHAVNTGLRKYKDNDEKNIISMYLNENKSMNFIAKSNGISVGLVQRILRKNNVSIKQNKDIKIKYGITKEFLDEELKLKSQKQISKELGCDASLISFYKKRFKI